MRKFIVIVKIEIGRTRKFRQPTHEIMARDSVEAAIVALVRSRIDADLGKHVTELWFT